MITMDDIHRQMAVARQFQAGPLGPSGKPFKPTPMRALGPMPGMPTNMPNPGAPPPTPQLSEALLRFRAMSDIPQVNQLQAALSGWRVQHPSLLTNLGGVSPQLQALLNQYPFLSGQFNKIPKR